ncbi:MAG: glycosyltransferase family 2 protein [Candidatus Latescibacteria bacterium]|nr:glycosyltransferase family 2 protein [Candidatus Latescibacterota bacterium]
MRINPLTYRDTMVSIVTPLYNCEKFIAATIESVILQSYTDWEMLIVDDNSDDASADIVSDYAHKDGRIRLFHNKTNQGAGASRNIAIQAAKGEIIFFLDSDDIWLPGKLEKQISFMLTGNHLFTFTAIEKIDENGNLLKKQPEYPKARLTYKQALKYNPIGCLSAAYNCEMLGKVFMPQIRKRQDYALWLALLKKTDAHCLQQVLARYRVRKESISSNKLDLVKYQWRLYHEIERLSLLKSLACIGSCTLHKILDK